TINLTVLDTSRVDRDTLLCFGEHFFWNDLSITTEGSYAYTTSNAAGCDSVSVLHVLYTPAPGALDTAITACGEALYEGQVFTQSASFTDTLVSTMGCDSLYRQVDIEVRHLAFDTLEVDICVGEQYTFNEISYAATTIVTDQF